MSANLTLKTQRLILRDFQETDWEAVHRYGGDPEVVRYMIWGPNSEEDTKDYIQKMSLQQLDQPRWNFDLAVILNTDNQLIGACGIHVLNHQNREGCIGYCFNKHFWAQGYASEAAKAMLSFGFEQLGLHRISATCDIENIASKRVLEKIGMQREGCLRSHQFIKGKWRDSLIYAILESEWKN
jgi:[ribosomal protein S5]-alanine N-acetyltransferase